MKFYNIETVRIYKDGVYCQECFKKELRIWWLVKRLDLPYKYQCQICGREPNRLVVFLKRLLRV